MIKMRWDIYYNSFYEMTLEEQIEYSKQLSNFGDPDEVYDVALELFTEDEEYATEFIRKAYQANIYFTSDQVIDFIDINDYYVVAEPPKTVFRATINPLFRASQSIVESH